MSVREVRKIYGPTDYERTGVSPLCSCGAKGGKTHNDTYRCGTCPTCKQRIQGIYWIEHTECCLLADTDKVCSVNNPPQLSLF